MITQVERLTGNLFPDRSDFKVHVILIVLANSLDFRGGRERWRVAWRGREQEGRKQLRPSPTGELGAVHSSEITVKADYSRTLPAGCHGRHVKCHSQNSLSPTFWLHVGTSSGYTSNPIHATSGSSAEQSVSEWKVQCRVLGRRCGDTHCWDSPHCPHELTTFNILMHQAQLTQAQAATDLIRGTWSINPWHLSSFSK